MRRHRVEHLRAAEAQEAVEEALEEAKLVQPDPEPEPKPKPTKTKKTEE